MKRTNILIGGLLAGSLICNMVSLAYFKRTHGILKIDTSNENKDFYRLEIDNIEDLIKVSKSKRFMLKVENVSNLSQE